METFLKFFKGSMVFTALALVLAYFIGGIEAMIIVAVLGVLETSLSFDNAIVNSKELAGMDALWRHRFLTWGMIIAVFGMRVVFPLLIVGIAAHLGPIAAVTLAIEKPDEYARILTSAHESIAGFGGAFLFMVAFEFFLDVNKEHHWIPFLEKPLVFLGKINHIQVAFTAVVTLLAATFFAEHPYTFLVAGFWGIVTFIGAKAIGTLLETEDHTGQVVRSGLAGLLYLELLDASFSFDGVVGAFALSNNLFVIALGLGIGAMFVRSLTLLLVEKGTLAEYKYLEHGAFYAIITLASIMYISLKHEIPEVVTGLVGGALIVASFIWSILHNRKATA